MFGNPKWFSPRKFGWGLGVNTWQGIAYILVMLALLAIVNVLPVELDYKLVLSGIVIAVFVIDILHIMMQVYSKLDERQQLHEALAERNASFVAIVGLVLYAFYVAMTIAPEMLEQYLIPLVGIALAMAAAKGFTLMYLERKS